MFYEALYKVAMPYMNNLSIWHNHMPYLADLIQNKTDWVAVDSSMAQSAKPQDLFITKEYSVDDRSVQVGRKQRICTIDGYAMPLTCRGGLMFLSILGKPTDTHLERYPAVHLTRPHEWDPSVLDYTHPSGDGEPPWSNDPDEKFAFDPNFDEFGDYTQSAIQTLSILDDSSSTLTPCSTLMTNQHVFRTYQHDVSHETPDYEKFRPDFGWVNVETIQKTMKQSTQWGVSLPNTFPMKKHLKSRNSALNIPRRHEAVATDTVFSDTPAVDSGVQQAQGFVGRDTLVADAYQ